MLRALLEEELPKLNLRVARTRMGGPCSPKLTIYCLSESPTGRGPRRWRTSMSVDEANFMRQDWTDGDLRKIFMIGIKSRAKAMKNGRL